MTHLRNQTLKEAKSEDEDSKHDVVEEENDELNTDDDMHDQLDSPDKNENALDLSADDIVHPAPSNDTRI